MKIFILIVFLSQAVVSIAAATPWSDEERLRESSQQIQYWRTWAAESSSWSDEEKLEKLMIGLRSMSRRSEGEGHNSEIGKLYKQLQGMASAIPGHAKYFTDKIDEALNSDEERIKTVEFTPDWEKYPRDSEIYKSNVSKLFDLWSNYAVVSAANIEVLSHIPSTESVRALGNYLRERNEPNMKYPPPDTRASAAEGLMRLISDGPILSLTAGSEEVGKWRQWFDEVKAGTRTFRFVGSDLDYTLDGPADARTLERIKRTRKQEKTEVVRERSAAQGASGNTPRDSNKSGNPAGITISLMLVVASLLWYCLKMGNRKQLR